MTAENQAILDRCEVVQSFSSQAEMWAYLEEQQRQFAMQGIRKISDYLKAGDEESAAECIDILFGNTGKWRSANILKFFYNNFTDPAVLYNLIINVYLNDGYQFPKQVMLRAKKLAKSVEDYDRYQDLPMADSYTVYRATASGVHAAYKELSWTTDKNIAIWFAHRYDGQLPSLRIYEATISRDKIIAYRNDRNEAEVIQHNDVAIRKELFPTAEEIEAAMKAHAKEV